MSRFRSLLQASLTATKRALTWNLEDLIPPIERYIFNFNSKDELKKWHLYSDSEYGGLSSASLEIKDTTDGSSTVGVFSGNLSLDVAEGSTWNMTRSGFCGMRSKKFDGFIDLDAYDTIALKLKGDGRCYISTIYTQNWVNSPGQEEDNSWQAFVFVPKDNWYIAKDICSQFKLLYLATDTSFQVCADMERELNKCRAGDESFSSSWHVSICECRRRSTRRKVWGGRFSCGN
nr:probable complex I intermediate-associated protein 30 [Ipomoea batatas]